MAPYDPPVHTHYTELDVSKYDEDFMWFCVGKKGKHFYDITTWLNLKYLWFDHKRMVVELWGPWESLSSGDARNKLADVIEKYNEIYIKPHEDTPQSQSGLSADPQQTTQSSIPVSA